MTSVSSFDELLIPVSDIWVLIFIFTHKCENMGHCLYLSSSAQAHAVPCKHTAHPHTPTIPAYSTPPLPPHTKHQPKIQIHPNQKRLFVIKSIPIHVNNTTTHKTSHIKTGSHMSHKPTTNSYCYIIII